MATSSSNGKEKEPITVSGSDSEDEVEDTIAVEGAEGEGSKAAASGMSHASSRRKAIGPEDDGDGEEGDDELEDPRGHRTKGLSRLVEDCPHVPLQHGRVSSLSYP